MTLLVIAPDYASHLLPLATLATAWHSRGEQVVVATGPSTDAIVSAFGFARVQLQLGRGSNPGVITADEQPDVEAESLRGFFDATRNGMIATLAYQARERLTDLMWDPVAAGQATLRVVDEVEPDAILIDHLAFSARLALGAAGHDYGDVVLGHPSALPVGDQIYGLPPAWPAAFHPRSSDLAGLRAVCEAVSSRFTREWNHTVRALNPLAPLTTDAFAAHGPLVLYNYPAELSGDEIVQGAEFLGSTRRAEAMDAEVDGWIASGEPFAYVSFGSFLSVRDDVLLAVADALRAVGIRAAIATGSTPPDALGALPASWLVRPYLPQVRLLAGAAIAVTHGGNNSVTEALGVGVPLLVLPFSTDQFAGAAAVERAGVGRALDPNRASVAELEAALAALLSGTDVDRALLSRIAAGQLADPGPERAYRALTSADMDSTSPDA